MKYNWTRWLSLGRKISLGGGIAGLVVVLLFGAVIMKARYDQVGQAIDESAKDLANVLHTTTGALFWNFDTGALEEIRKTIKTDYLEGIVWLDKEGKPILPATQEKREYEIFKQVVEFKDKDGGMVGQIEIHYNKRAQWEAFIKDARMIIVGIAIILFIQLGGLAGSWWSSRKMLESLGHLVVQIRSSSESAFEKSDRMKETATNVLDIAQDQSASVHETMAAVEEIRSMMARSADNISASSRSAVEGDQLAQEGKRIVHEMITSVKDINESNAMLLQKVHESNNQIQGMVAMIREISTKTKVINEIVFQTKLLSFNAAVEAARAGEHGKGFSVVAEEVGNLARVSGAAAEEIDRLLEQGVAKTEEIVARVSAEVGSVSEAGKKKVDQGVRVAGECGKILDQLATQVKSVRERMDEVSMAVKDQGLGIENIATAMNKIEQSTAMNDKNARVGQEVAEGLVSEAAELKVMVESMEKSLFARQGQSDEGSAPAESMEDPSQEDQAA